MRTDLAHIDLGVLGGLTQNAKPHAGPALTSFAAELEKTCEGDAATASPQPSPFANLGDRPLASPVFSSAAPDASVDVTHPVVPGAAFAPPNAAPAAPGAIEAAATPLAVPAQAQADAVIANAAETPAMPPIPGDVRAKLAAGAIAVAAHEHVEVHIPQAPAPPLAQPENEALHAMDASRVQTPGAQATQATQATQASQAQPPIAVAARAPEGTRASGTPTPTKGVRPAEHQGEAAPVRVHPNDGASARAPHAPDEGAANDAADLTNVVPQPAAPQTAVQQTAVQQTAVQQTAVQQTAVQQPAAQCATPRMDASAADVPLAQEPAVDASALRVPVQAGAAASPKAARVEVQPTMDGASLDEPKSATGGPHAAGDGKVNAASRRGAPARAAAKPRVEDLVAASFVPSASVPIAPAMDRDRAPMSFVAAPISDARAAGRTPIAPAVDAKVSAGVPQANDANGVAASAASNDPLAVTIADIAGGEPRSASALDPRSPAMSPPTPQRSAFAEERAALSPPMVERPVSEAGVSDARASAAMNALAMPEAPAGASAARGGSPQARPIDRDVRADAAPLRSPLEPRIAQEARGRAQLPADDAAANPNVVSAPASPPRAPAPVAQASAQQAPVARPPAAPSRVDAAPPPDAPARAADVIAGRARNAAPSADAPRAIDSAMPREAHRRDESLAIDPAELASSPRAPVAARAPVVRPDAPPSDASIPSVSIPSVSIPSAAPAPLPPGVTIATSARVDPSVSPLSRAPAAASVDASKPPAPPDRVFAPRIAAADTPAIPPAPFANPRVRSNEGDATALLRDLDAAASVAIASASSAAPSRSRAAGSPAAPAAPPRSAEAANRDATTMLRDLDTATSVAIASLAASPASAERTPAPAPAASAVPLELTPPDPSRAIAAAPAVAAPRVIDPAAALAVAPFVADAVAQVRDARPRAASPLAAAAADPIGRAARARPVVASAPERRELADARVASLPADAAVPAREAASLDAAPIDAGASSAGAPAPRAGAAPRAAAAPPQVAAAAAAPPRQGAIAPASDEDAPAADEVAPEDRGASKELRATVGANAAVEHGRAVAASHADRAEAPQVHASPAAEPVRREAAAPAAPRAAQPAAPEQPPEHRAVAVAVNRMTLQRAAHAEVDVPELGRIAVTARTRQKEVDVSVTAPIHSVGVLRAAGGDLSSSLRDASIRVGSLSIGADGGAGAGGSGHRTGGDAQSGSDRTDAQSDADAPPHVGHERRVRVVM